jgi:hypothetical protein
LASKAAPGLAATISSFDFPLFLESGDIFPDGDEHIVEFLEFGVVADGTTISRNDDCLVRRCCKVGVGSGDHSNAAISALKELGVLSGKRVERSERGEPGEFDRMSDEELRQAVSDRAEQLGFIPKNKTQQ